MKKTAINLLSASLLALSFSSFSQNQANLSFTAKLDGSQATPSNGSIALGVANLKLSAGLDSLWVQVDYTGLQGTFSSAHIHTGAVGVSGGVAFPLATPSGNRITDLITGASLTGSVIANLFNGMYYVNIHTSTFAGGEIRGQIYPEADLNYSCILNAAQAVPASSNPNVFGVASFNLSKNSGVLTYKVVVNNLTGPIQSAHLHKGVAGVAGGVLGTLTVNANSVLSGTLSPATFLNALLTDSVYINVHTTANGSGEARGQLRPMKGLFASAYLNGAQETPTVITKGRGEAAFFFSTDLDSVYCSIAADSLTGTVSGAHLHFGALGVSGGVALNMTTGILGNGNTVLFSGPVTPALIDAMVKDGVYINLHTSINPNGEIRGQLVPFARYTGAVCLTGGQETPAVTTTAMGGGIVSVDRGLTNAHIMVVASGLSAAASGAHIHNGNIGVSGGVAYNLTGFYANDGIFTYWTGSSSPAFVTANGTADLAGGLYLNIHNSTYANGELRGQIGYECSSFTTGIKNTVLENVRIYPNPATSSLQISIPVLGSNKLTVKIYDLIGNLVINQDYNAVSDIKLNIASLTAGLYVVQIQNGNLTTQSKFIKD